MPDIVTREVRKKMMSKIHGKNTKPELSIRKGLHRLGFRFRLSDSGLPGKPDIVFPRYRAVIFVNGCFWHCHDCHLFKWPNTNEEFWHRKISRNKVLDRINIIRLGERGWRVGVVWECSLKGKYKIPYEEVILKCSQWLKSDIQLIEIGGNQ
ncbi:MAG: DNA mismatch endonuclease Vsr [Desulfosporosinus sp.]